MSSYVNFFFLSYVTLRELVLPYVIFCFLKLCRLTLPFVTLRYLMFPYVILRLRFLKLCHLTLAYVFL